MFSEKTRSVKVFEFDNNTDTTGAIQAELDKFMDNPRWLVVIDEVKQSSTSHCTVITVWYHLEKES